MKPLLAFAAGSALLALAACNADDAEEAGENVDDAIEETTGQESGAFESGGERLDETAERLEDAAQDARDAAEDAADEAPQDDPSGEDEGDSSDGDGDAPPRKR